MSKVVTKSLKLSLLLSCILDDAGRSSDLRYNLESRCTALKQLSDFFHIDFSNVDQSATYELLQWRFKSLHQKHLKAAKSGRKKEQFFAYLDTKVEIPLVLKSNIFAQEFLNRKLSNKDGIIAHQQKEITVFREKVSELCQFQLENISLREEISSLKATKRNLKARGPSVAHLNRSKIYSPTQTFRKKKLLCEKIKEFATYSGLSSPNKPKTVRFGKPDGTAEEFCLKTGNKRIVDGSPLKFGPEKIDELIIWKVSHLVPNEAFHELSMVLGKQRFPRSHVVHKRIKSLNDSTVLKNVPGVYDGKQLPFAAALRSHLEILNEQGLLDGVQEIRLKLTADGTKCGKRLHLVTFGYQIILNSHEQRFLELLMLLKCPEKYGPLKEALCEQNSEMKEMKSIQIGDKLFDLKFYQGADLKMINVSRGIDACNCNYFCPWCLCPKAKRADFSLFWSMINPEGSPRSLQEMSNLAALSSAGQKKQGKNQSNEPIFNFVETCDVVPDTLHCFLRLSDLLIDKLLAELRRLDNISESVGAYDRENMNLTAKFEDFVRSLNIEFSFFIDPNSKRKGLNFTSLPSNQRMRIFENINVNDYLDPSNPKTDQINFLFHELLDLYHLMNQTLSESDIDRFETRAQKWVKVFAHDVFLCDDVTPYCHILYYHLAEAMRLHGNIGIFSQQSWELLNNIVTKNYFQGTNKWGLAAFDQIVKRQERIMKLSPINHVKSLKRKYQCNFCRGMKHNFLTCPKRLRF